MATAEQRNHAKSFLRKAEEYLASAEPLPPRTLPARSPSAPKPRRLGGGLRELLAAKGDVEYGTALIGSAKAEPLVRRARTLVDLAIEVVRLGR